MKHKKFALLLSIFSILAGLSAFYLHFLPPVHKAKKKYRYAILLGCPAHDDGTMSRSQLARCTLAINTWIHYDTLVITGGAVKNEYPEAEVMATYIRKNSLVPVICETRARNTWENLANVREMIGDQPVLLLTSELHAARASAMARQFFPEVAVLTYTDIKPKHIFKEFGSQAKYIQLELQKHRKKQTGID